MKLEIDINDFVKHLMFWSNKTDDECVEMAISESGLDAEQALMNMLERDFCNEVINKVGNELKNNKK